MSIDDCYDDLVNTCIDNKTCVRLCEWFNFLVDWPPAGYAFQPGAAYEVGLDHLLTKHDAWVVRRGIDENGDDNSRVHMHPELVEKLRLFIAVVRS